QRAVRTVLITSTMPKEGKTTTAVALARLLASTGKRVILVDCDLRRPRIHSALDSVIEPGLANHLLMQFQIFDVIRRDTKSPVDFISAGRCPFDPSTLLESHQMRLLLEHLAKVYDLVILDSAPVLAVSDARILCRFVDKTVYLLRWAGTRRKAAANGVRQ